MRFLLTSLFILITTKPVTAQQAFLTSQCQSAYPEAMMFVQDQLRQRGYKISRVQHVDKGLKSRGYESRRYRVVFFGKPDEINIIRTQYSALIPFFPLNITVFEEPDHIGVSAIDPMQIYRLYGEEVLTDKFKQWSQDIQAVVKAFKHCSE
ncbi:MAG: DUF302 domain-containing protein [Gammaproteobacteria bacterium]|nr:DUF302 domain-containing protein [Gammaproteobacteria bacterium]